MERTLVVRPHRGGFFSNFNKVISTLHHNLGRDGVEAVVVDWTLAAPVPHFPYGNAADGNVWDRLFEPLTFDRFPGEREVLVDYPLDSGMLSGMGAYALYKSRGWRQRYHETFRRHIRVRPYLMRRAEAILGGPAPFRIGVHYRHAGHDAECPSPIPQPSVFIDRVRRIAGSRDDWQVVLATDVNRTVEQFRAAFGDRLIQQPGVKRSSNDEQLHEVSPGGDIALAEGVLVDALLLARCDALLHVTSNVATAVGYMNPKVMMHYSETTMEAARTLPWRLRVVASRSALGPSWRRLKKSLRPLLGGGRREESSSRPTR